jgi:DNA (cytosine-5)-methyltransferase 1
MTDKPIYRVPTMGEVREIEPNGIKVVSTFSGCGGSSLGYRLAGCEVVAASEFVPAAVDTYLANAKPGTQVFTEDIRELSGETILERIGMTKGELDILDGSPPCSAFSMAGKRSKGWGEVSSYSDTRQRVDDLFYEYARLVNDLQPRAFIAENVAGLVRGVSKGYFQRIFRTLEECGYTVRAAVLDASWLGVPQSRERLFLLGIRNDLGIAPTHPKALPYRYLLGDALQGLPDDIEAIDPETGQDISFSRYAIGPEWEKVRPGESSDRYFQLVRTTRLRPCNTITATAGQIGAASPTHPDYPRKFTLAELRRICSFPDDFILTGNYEQRAERLGRSVPPVLMSHVAGAVVKTLKESQ